MTDQQFTKFISILEPIISNLSSSEPNYIALSAVCISIAGIIISFYFNYSKELTTQVIEDEIMNAIILSFPLSEEHVNGECIPIEDITSKVKKSIRKNSRYWFQKFRKKKNLREGLLRAFNSLYTKEILYFNGFGAKIPGVRIINNENWISYEVEYKNKIENAINKGLKVL